MVLYMFCLRLNERIILEIYKEKICVSHAIHTLMCCVITLITRESYLFLYSEILVSAFFLHFTSNRFFQFLSYFDAADDE